MMDANSSRDLIHYEIETIVSVLTKDYLQQAKSVWFSLKEAYEFYGPMTDVNAVFFRTIAASPSQAESSICKLLAVELRRQHFHLAPRLFLAGKLQTAVWRTTIDFLHFDRERASVRPGTRGAPSKTEFDLIHKWKLGAPT